MKKLLNHLKTVHTHRKEVRKLAFQLGIPFRGLVHDLSKYSPTELKICKYYDGKISPHDIAREELGFSPSWYHHKNKNKHHWEHWLDFNGGYFNNNGDFVIPSVAVKIPYKYVVEMFCDFVGAGKTYNKQHWTTSSPLEYWKKVCNGERLMNAESEWLLVFLLTRLNECSSLGEFVSWYRKQKRAIKADYEKEKSD